MSCHVGGIPLLHNFDYKEIELLMYQCQERNFHALGNTVRDYQGTHFIRGACGITLSMWI